MAGAEVVPVSPVFIMTVEEFKKTSPLKQVKQELRSGRILEVPPAKSRHLSLQLQLIRLLRDALESQGFVGGSEIPFRPLPEYECWIADVAYVLQSRLASVADNDYLAGAPELVIEVASASNSAEDLEERETICLSNGCREFWIVHPRTEKISIATVENNGQSRRKYGLGETIELTVVKAQVSVQQIFSW